MVFEACCVGTVQLSCSSCASADRVFHDVTSPFQFHSTTRVCGNFSLDPSYPRELVTHDHADCGMLLPFSSSPCRNPSPLERGKRNMNNHGIITNEHQPPLRPDRCSTRGLHRDLISRCHLEVQLATTWGLLWCSIGFGTMSSSVQG